MVTIEALPTERRETLQRDACALPIDACAPGRDLFDLLTDQSNQPESDAERIAAIAGWARLGAWVAAREAAAVAEFTERTITAVSSARSVGGRDFVTGEELAAAEIGAALRLSPNAAAGKVNRAQALATTCRPTRDALESGAISDHHARVIVETVAGLPLMDSRRVQSRVLAQAANRTVGQLRRILARALLAVDPWMAAKNAAQAIADRSVSIWAHAPAVAWLGATMRADHAQQIFAELDRRARLAPSDDPRALGARRADALLALCLPHLYRDLDPSGERTGAELTGAELTGAELVGAASCGESPHQARCVVRVTMTRDALLGITDTPADLEGHGPIPANLAREMAADGEWERWLLQPQTGELLDTGALTYRPTRRFADFIEKRDQTCRFPGCRRAATRCDIEHAVPLDHATPTLAGTPRGRTVDRCVGCTTA